MNTRTSNSPIDPELYQIQCNDGTGGFDQQQIQLALAHLFKDNQTVYVPSCTHLLGENASLPLPELKSSGIHYVALSFNVDRGHQIGVWVQLTGSNPSFRLFDSLSSSLTLKAQERLSRLLGVHAKIPELARATSYYPKQTDHWSCGVHVIANLLKAHKQADIDANEAELNVTTLSETYYKAYLSHRKHEETTQEKAEQDFRNKNLLLDILEVELSKHLPEESENNPLKKLADFLQYECWGNLDRQPNPLDQTGRLMEQEKEEIRNRALPFVLTAYIAAHPTDEIGQLILKAACFNLKAQPNHYKLAMETCIKFLGNQSDERAADNKKDIRDKVLLLIGEIDLDADAVTDKAGYLKNLLDILTSGNTSRVILSDFLKRIDRDEFKSNILSPNDDFVVHGLFRELSVKISNLEQDQKAQELTRKSALSVYEKMEKKQIKRIDEVLYQIGMRYLSTSQDKENKELYLRFRKNPIAYYFLTKYVDRDFFNANFLGILVKLKTISTLNERVTVLKALKLFSGKNAIGFIKKHQDGIFDDAEFWEIVGMFVPEHRLEIILEQKERIRNFIKLLLVLKMLPEKSSDRFILAQDHEDKIQNVRDLAHVLTLLKETGRILDFAIACKNKIENLDALLGSSIASLLQPTDWVVFLKANQDKIQNFEGLLKFINYLPTDERLEVIESHENMIENIGQLHYIAYLPGSTNFIKSRLKNYEDFIEFIQIFPLEDRLKTIETLSFNWLITILPPTLPTESLRNYLSPLDEKIFYKKLTKARYPYAQTLLNALKMGDHELAEVLIADEQDLSYRDDYGYSLLHWAAMCNNLAIAKILVDRGVDPQATTVQGETALHWAAWMGYPQMVQYLIGQGCDPNQVTKKNKTALEGAVYEAHFQTIKVLLLHIHSPNIETRVTYLSLLRRCIIDGDIPRLEKVLQKPGLSQKILQLALAHFPDVKTSTAIFELLLNKIHEVNFEDLLPLSIKMVDNPQIIILLKQKGMDFNQLDKTGHTLLHYARLNHSHEVTTMLIQQGADPFFSKESDLFRNIIELGKSCWGDERSKFLLDTFNALKQGMFERQDKEHLLYYFQNLTTIDSKDLDFSKIEPKTLQENIRFIRGLIAERPDWSTREKRVALSTLLRGMENELFSHSLRIANRFTLHPSPQPLQKQQAISVLEEEANKVQTKPPVKSSKGCILS